MIMLAALLVAPLAGWLIKAGNGWLGQPNLGYQAVFTLAFLTGVAGTACFLLIPEPHRRVRARPAAGTTDRALERGRRQSAVRRIDRERLRVEPRAPGGGALLQRLPGPSPRRGRRDRRPPRGRQHALRAHRQRPLRPRHGPSGRAEDPGAHGPADPDHPHRLDLGHRALAGRRARGLRRARLGRLQPGQLRAPARAHPRGPTAPRPWRSTRRWCSRAPWRARSSAGGSPTRSGSRSSSARAAPGRLLGIAALHLAGRLADPRRARRAPGAAPASAA